MTYTYAILEVSRATYDEIAAGLRAADYRHAFAEAGVIDMHGVALQAKKRGEAEPGAVPTWAEAERQAISRALTATGGRKGAAAQLLGMSRSTLWRKLQEAEMWKEKRHRG